MTENINQMKDPSFRRGGLVKLRDEYVARKDSFIQKEEVYRVLYIERHSDEGGNCAWIGPRDIPEEDVRDFRPYKAMEGRYKGKVRPIATLHLIPLYH